MVAESERVAFQANEMAENISVERIKLRLITIVAL